MPQKPSAKNEYIYNIVTLKVLFANSPNVGPTLGWPVTSLASLKEPTKG